MFYTYLWLREDGTPYYVGKGKGQRGFKSTGHITKCPANPSRIIVQLWPCEEDSFAAEKFLIEYYGRKDLGTGCLRNRTDGGDGASGRVYVTSEETKIKLSKAHLGKVMDEETKEKIRIGNTGKVRSAEARHKYSLSKKGQVPWCKGKRLPEEMRLKISAGLVGKTLSSETRAKISESLRGIKQSAETLQKRKQTMDALYERDSLGHVRRKQQ
jgi:hypothetical protein